ncbi:bacteriocin immunity protein [Latilactobacillus sakei]|uniref:OrfY protein n=2 Tax=Latilactobacillus TaxID=2767885 RepID=Q57161_LATSK|nr:MULTISPECIES: bacteriocin immunity protein [Latilactobacillus]AAB93971.1 putative sakacin P immunity protein [Latilactobacillus sakei]AAM88859.1 putative sakacin P immunity protein [Latilactobacillus sakei]AAW79058.1 SpiA [Latilactobacillus sakei]AAY44079.1 sakacin P immunity protein [Latilactobacillus curvatus]AAY44081.1 sakacin P immunity protein [Latilactobacillus curvatus]
MKILKWYSGGKDRGERANDIIGQLLLDLNHDPKNEHLEAILINYQNEIKRKESSVPFILSRMNISIANTIRRDRLILTDFQEDKLKLLTALSNIRYGY